jgi:hypothetical protein
MKCSICGREISDLSWAWLCWTVETRENKKTLGAMPKVCCKHGNPNCIDRYEVNYAPKNDKKMMFSAEMNNFVFGEDTAEKIIDSYVFSNEDCETIRSIVSGAKRSMN